MLLSGPHVAQHLPILPTFAHYGKRNGRKKAQLEQPSKYNLPLSYLARYRIFLFWILSMLRDSPFGLRGLGFSVFLTKAAVKRVMKRRRFADTQCE